MKRASGAIAQKASQSLAGYLTLIITGLLAAALVPLTGLFIMSDIQHQADTRWMQARAAANVLAVSAEAAVVTHDPARAAADLRAIAHMPGVTYARIEAHDGSALAAVGQRPAGPALNSETATANVKTLLSATALSVQAPVMSGGHQVGQVVIGHSMKVRFVTPLTLGVVAVWLVVFGAALGMELRFRRMVGAPLRALGAVMDAAESNDFSQRVPLSAQAEISGLAMRFNAMLEALQWRDRKLEAHLLGLESDAVETREELDATRAALKAAVTVKSGFLAAMRRDVLAPMNAMVIAAELLAAESLPLRVQRRMRSLAQSGRSLLAAVHDHFDLSRIEAGQVDVEICETDILDCVDDTLALFQAQARTVGVELVASAHPDAPRLVPVDPQRLAQVIAHLVSNALKFTTKGHVLVSVEPDKKIGFWRLVVRDTGMGIARDKLGALFAPEAAGHGLVRIRRLVEAMGGAIAVTSEQGKGTQFHVRMPALDYSPPGNVNMCAPPVIHDLVRPVVNFFIRGDTESEVLAERLKAANVRFGPDKPRLVLADAVNRDHLDAGIKPEILVLLAWPEDLDAEQWVRDGRAVAVLSRPLCHRDIDALIERLRDGGDFVLYDADADPEGVDAAWPQVRVLVVDDGEVNREVAIEALARFGIAAAVAVDGADALEKMQQQAFDLVLMDGSMPVMDGFEATRQWRMGETGIHLPIVALTAHVVGHAAHAWKEAGMDDVLHKPFTLRDMAAILRAHLPETLRTDALPRVAEIEDAPLPVLPETDGDLFDKAVIGSLVEGLHNGRSDFVRRVVGLYRSHAPEAATTMQAAHAESDEDRLARAAHALKSMSLNIGAKTVAGVAGGIERAIRVEHRAVAADEIAMAATWVERTIAGLAQMIGDEPAPVAVKPKKKKAATAAPKDNPESALIREIEADIEAGAFEMEYQPIYDRTGIDVVSAEALMRWRRGDRAPIGPAVFIPVAERAGLITRLGTFARRRVLETAANWAVPVAINVSPIELDKPGFVAGVRALLDETGFDPKRLIFEVTETAFLGDPDRVRQLFNDLRAMGIKLALDDFGVGYSSLTSLHRFPFDKIKIDREFVMALDGEPRAALEALAIIQAVTGIGRAFGMQVAAEGIETTSQHSHLKAAGVHSMQGYLFGKAMPANAFSNLIGKAPVLQRG